MARRFDVAVSSVVKCSQQTWRYSPVMAAFLGATPWSMEDVMKLIDARAAKPNRPAAYRKAAPAQISN